MAICHVEKFADTGVDLGQSIFLDHADQVALADLAGTDQGIQVAFLVTARAHIRKDEDHNVGTRLSRSRILTGGERRSA